METNLWVMIVVIIILLLATLAFMTSFIVYYVKYKNALAEINDKTTVVMTKTAQLETCNINRKLVEDGITKCDSEKKKIIDDFGKCTTELGTCSKKGTPVVEPPSADLAKPEPIINPVNTTAGDDSIEINTA